MRDRLNRISMTHDDLKKYETILLDAQAGLSKEIKDVIRGGADMGEIGSRDEEADETEESGIAHAEQIALKGRLHAVLDALERVKAGTYGTCLKCGGPISMEVLDAAPESLYCSACK
jgi:RNA polymerase-binding transcription factor DksA